jgi:hypothetical protein
VCDGARSLNDLVCPSQQRLGAFGIVHHENELLTLLEPQFPETVSQPIDGLQVRAALQEDSHAVDTGLLRIDRDRQREEGQNQDAREREP